MNRQTMAVVRKLKDPDGGYLWERAIAAGQPPLLLGRPVYEAVDMPNPVAGNTPIVFGDFATGYAIADRTGFEIVRDDLTGLGNGVVKLHARRRVGGRVVMGEATTAFLTQEGLETDWVTYWTQMSTDLDQHAREILFFAGDCWPVVEDEGTAA